MKKLFTFLLYAMMIIAVGCTESFDDSQIWDKLNSLENRVAALEQLCKQMNTNISSLQKVINAMQNNDYVTNIAPITEDGKVIGYTITFSKSGAVTIYHGKDGKDGTNGADGADGKDGYTPVIGVAKDSDGVYYWTLDGDWLLDKDGNKVKAEGVDGKDGQNGANGNNGQDGITPKLKIENDNWYISYDNGTTWNELGKATGEDGKDGDSMFKDVVYDDDYVYITLTDGTVLKILREYGFLSSSIPYNQIWYTTSDEKVVGNLNGEKFNRKITSHVYENGKGVITFDGNIVLIPESAFSQRYNLTSITIPESVLSIGAGAFYYCSNLKGVTIPKSVVSIGEGAFSLCSSLTSVSIPEGVTEIEKNMFADCTSLTNITLPKDISYIAYRAFCGCSSLTDISIPESVAWIGEGAFCCCDNLTSITIPKSITYIANFAFSGCSSLTDVIIPESVTSIGSYAFSDCKVLKSITIPESVTEINNWAFYGCTALMSVYCKPTTPPTLIPLVGNEGIFTRTPSGLKMYVPLASVDAYKSAYREYTKRPDQPGISYASFIVGYNFE